MTFLFGLLLGLTGLLFSQTNTSNLYKLALPNHDGKLSWNAPGFTIVQNSAKSSGSEIGVRGLDNSSELSFLGFLFRYPELAPLNSKKCHDGILEHEKKGGAQVLGSIEIDTPGKMPVVVTTYRKNSSYAVRGFVASGDICGDLEVYSKKKIDAGDPRMTSIFSTLVLDPGYQPQFADVAFFGQILYQNGNHQAAAPWLEKALLIVPSDGAPFQSAKIAKRILTDQAGMAHGISGDLTKARAIFEKAIAVDPDYPYYYYNLACADAGEKKLVEARVIFRRLSRACRTAILANPYPILPLMIHSLRTEATKSSGSSSRVCEPQANSRARMENSRLGDNAW